jgi:hypothetical protein
MAATSVTTIRRIKDIYAESIRRDYGAPVEDARAAKNARLNDENKRLMKEIEDLVLAKYPSLEWKLRCDRNSSTYSSNEITVSFTSEPTNAEINDLNLKFEQAKEKFAFAVKSLDDWEMQALKATAEREKLPDFKV